MASKYFTKTPVGVCLSVSAPFCGAAEVPCARCQESSDAYLDRRLEKSVVEMVSSILHVIRLVQNENLERSDGRYPILDLIDQTMNDAATGSNFKFHWQK